MSERVCRVSADVVLPLRHAVLRTGRAWADALYEADTDPRSAHFAVFESTPDDVAVLAVGSVLPERPDWFDVEQGHGHPADRIHGQPAGRIHGEPGDPSHPGRSAWRVRGMATRPDHRGSGIGTLVLAALLDHVRSQGGGLVWCTARLGALTFYERGGVRHPRRSEPCRGHRTPPDHVARGGAGRISRRRGLIARRRPVTMWGSRTDHQEPPTFPVS